MTSISWQKLNILFFCLFFCFAAFASIRPLFSHLTFVERKRKFVKKKDCGKKTLNKQTFGGKRERI